MALSKKYFRLPGSSILESVISLSIISVCLFVSVMVYTAVFSEKTSPKFYISRNQTDAIFFLMQVQPDSVYENSNLIVTEEWHNAGLQEITVKRKDSNSQVEKRYFINSSDEN